MCSFSTFCDVFFFLFYCKVFLSDTPVAAGELFRDFFSFAILARNERHTQWGFCGTFVIYTCQNGKRHRLRSLRADRLLHVTVHI